MAQQLRFGPGLFCANCYSTTSNLSPALGVGSGIYTGCSCSGCQEQNFSRCGKCHIVSYCSRDCQREHWPHHKKICKMFSKNVQFQNQNRSGDQVVKVIFYTNYGPNNMKLENSLAFQYPFPVDLRHQHGWIDEYLVCLQDIVQRLADKTGRIRDSTIWGSLLTMRGFYLFFFSMERDSKVTELNFAVSMWVPLLSDFRETVESVMGAESTANDLKESFIFTLASFLRTLGMVKYKFINLKSGKKKRRTKYKALKPYYDHGLKMFEDVGFKKTPEGYQTKTRESLPPNTQCVGCAADLGGEKAQLLLPSPGGDFLREDFNILRVADTPFILGMVNTDTIRPIVSCGKVLSCNQEATKVYLDSMNKEYDALVDFLSDTRICHGCFKYSMKTHRCSRCRQARYCSQNCLNRNWEEHQVRCREFTRPGIQELYLTKRLEGEAKNRHGVECARSLTYDRVLLLSENQ